MSTATSPISSSAEAVSYLVKRHSGTALIASVILVFGATLYFGVRSYEGKLAKADTAYKQLQAVNSADEAALKDHVAIRAAQSADIRKEDKTRQERDTGADSLKAEVLAPSESVSAVQAYSAKYLDSGGDPSPDGSFTFKKQAVQQFISTKIDDTTEKADVADLAAKSATLEDMVKSTQGDLASCESDKAATDKVLVDYKKAAKASKWHRALDITEKAGLFAAGALVVHELSKP